MNPSGKGIEAIFYTGKGVVVKELQASELAEATTTKVLMTCPPFGTYSVVQLGGTPYIPLLSKTGGLLLIDARMFEDIAAIEAEIADEERVRRRLEKSLYVGEAGGPLGELYELAKTNSDEFARYILSRKREVGLRVG
jgi:hypothetical protein